MPPSGFSQKAINGLLEFVNANYRVIAEKYEGRSLSERDFLEQTADELERQVRTTLIERFPDATKLNGGIEGLTTFVSECYRDLAQEICIGYDKHSRLVIDGNAIQKELNQIHSYLVRFKI